jgi:hypothetical protein
MALSRKGHPLKVPLFFFISTKKTGVLVSDSPRWRSSFLDERIRLDLGRAGNVKRAERAGESGGVEGGLGARGRA